VLKDLSGYHATLLPVRSVGVQGDGRTYSYVAALTCNGEPDWEKLLLLSRVIPRVCHSVNRIVYMWGPMLTTDVPNITPTHLRPDVLDSLRQVCMERTWPELLASTGSAALRYHFPCVHFPFVTLPHSSLPLPSLTQLSIAISLRTASTAASARCLSSWSP